MNPLLAYAQECPMAKLLGKEMQSTWWGDYCVAEMLGGQKGVQDTFNRAWKYWRNDKIYTTELSLVLNWKCWKWADKYQQSKDQKDKEMSQLYEKLWLKLHDWVLDNWKGEDLSFYLAETD